MKRTPEDLSILREMLDLRLEGKTFQQIADQFGVSKQCVQQKISALCGTTAKRKNRKTDLEEKCIYPNLFSWFMEERIKLIELSDLIGLNTKNTIGIRERLIGKKQFKISEIKKILDRSGQSFEYLFAEKEGDSN